MSKLSCISKEQTKFDNSDGDAMRYWERIKTVIFLMLKKHYHFNIHTCLEKVKEEKAFSYKENKSSSNFF
jgi:hypothetical protein